MVISVRYYSIIPIILIVLGGYMVLSGQNLLAITGSTIISIDNIKVASNVEGISGPVYLITMTVGGNDRITGEITPDMIQQYGIKEIPSGPFYLDFQIENMSCNYDLVNDNLTLYKIWQYTAQEDYLPNGCPFSYAGLTQAKASIVRGTSTWTDAHGTRHTGVYVDAAGNRMLVDTPPSDELRTSSDRSTVASHLQFLNQWCYWTPGDQFSYVMYRHSPWGLRYITTTDPDLGKQTYKVCCAWAGKGEGIDPGDWRVTSAFGYPYYLGYRINSIPKLHYNIKVSIKNSNGEIASTYVTDKDKVADLAGIGRVKLIGQLMGEYMCGQPGQDYAAVKEVYKNGLSLPGTYKIVPKSYYNAYKTGLAELVNLDIDRFTIHINKVSYDPGIGGGPVWTYLSKLNTDLRYIHDNAKTSIGDYYVTSDGMVVSNYTGVPYIPMLQLIIRSDWIGVEIVSGVPKIESVSLPSKIASGGTALAQVKVANTGEHEDQFEVYAICGGNKQISSYITLKPNEEGNVSIPLIIPNTGNQTCTVYDKSTSDPTKVDSYQTSVMIQQPLIIGDLIKMQRLVYERFSDTVDDYDATINAIRDDITALRSNISDYEYKILSASNSSDVVKYGIELSELTHYADNLYSRLDNLDNQITSFQSEQEMSVLQLRDEYNKELNELEDKVNNGEIDRVTYENQKAILQYQIDQLDHLISTEIANRKQQVSTLKDKIAELKDRLMKDKLIQIEANKNLSEAKKKMLEEKTKNPTKTMLGAGLLGIGLIGLYITKKEGGF